MNEQERTQAAETPTPPPPATNEPSAWRRWLPQVGIALALLLAFAIGMELGAPDPVEVADEHAEHEASTEVWTCSMHPQIRRSEPGQCPICGMDLILAETEAGREEGAANRARLSERAQALAQLRTTPITRVAPDAEHKLLGKVDYDESRFRMITPWVGGRIDRLHVRTTGTEIKRGQTVATIYSPEVYAAMRDLVTAAKQVERLSKGMHGTANLASAALESARERLRLLGIPDQRIATIEKNRKVPKQIAISSPFGGTVLERKVEQGDYVQAGTVLFHVADLSQVWVQLEAYETDLPHLAVGQPVDLSITSLPGETFEGRVAFIDPVIDPKTRTARVRVEVPNPDGVLRPGMFAEAVIESPVAEAGTLTVPASAVLFTGRRSVVYVQVPGQPGVYELREVRLGPKAGSVYPVLSGLADGEEVVTQGAFVLDADVQLNQGGLSMMAVADDIQRKTPDVVVTADVLAALRPVMESYLQAQRLLAQDELDAAREALGNLADLVNAVSLSAPRETRQAWEDIASELVGHARQAQASDEGGELRSAFELVSAQMSAVLQVFGNPLAEPVRVAFCPMAFDNQGAEWIQREETVNNPYYGSAMLRCGEVKGMLMPGERLSPTPTAPRPATTAGGHQH